MKHARIWLTLMGVIITIIASQLSVIHKSMLSLGSFGIIGIFIAGMMFVSTFTVSLGTLLLIIFTRQFPIIFIVFIAGLGAVMSDLAMFRFFRHDLMSGALPFYKRLGGKKLHHIFHSRYMQWMLPVIGAIIIASPLPDELGVGLLGISKLSQKEFALISFILNSAGIFVVLSAYTGVMSLTL